MTAESLNSNAAIANTGLIDSPLFTRWEDPVSGIKSFVLSERVAPHQQTFYFVNPSISADGRYYWFYCAFPPAGNANEGRALGVVDLLDNRAHYFPETAFTDASPMVDARTGEVYWCTGLEIWKRSPILDAAPVLVHRFPKKLAHNRRPWRLATHLTFSADRSAVNVDAEIGGISYVGHAPLDGGEFVLWQQMDRVYNHAQFSPVDPDLQLVAQDSAVDPLTGEYRPYDIRLWLIRRGGKAEPVFPEPLTAAAQVRQPNTGVLEESPKSSYDARGMHGHEWWGADGQSIWYVHYGTGVERVALGSTTPELVWPHHTVSHAHASADGRLLVLDSLPQDQPEDRRVTFINLETRRTVHIVSCISELDPAMRRYHIHPHPQFCLNDQYISYTTTIGGRLDVAFASVAQLVAHTS